MVFKAKTDSFRWAIVGFVLFVYMGLGLLIYFTEKKLDAVFGLGAIWLLLAVLIIWILPNSTRYTFLEEELLCQSLFIKKRIPYSSIRKIEAANGFYAGWKMSTAWKCLLICYNKYDELLISPENESDFIEICNQKKAQFASAN